MKQTSLVSNESMLDMIEQTNPLLRAKFDFKSILFSDKNTVYTPEESEDIYTGKKQIRLSSQVKYMNGRIELSRQSNKEMLEIISKLKTMTASVNNEGRKARRSAAANIDDDYGYAYGDDDEEANEWENDEDDDDYYDDEYGGYEDDDAYLDEDAYYKEMMRDMEADMEKDISVQMRREMMQDVLRDKSGMFAANPSARVNTNSSNGGKMNNNKKKDGSKDEKEEEWETDSEEEEDDDDDAEGNDGEEFASIKVPDEDYED